MYLYVTLAIKNEPRKKNQSYPITLYKVTTEPTSAEQALSYYKNVEGYIARGNNVCHSKDKKTWLFFFRIPIHVNLTYTKK